MLYFHSTLQEYFLKRFIMNITIIKKKTENQSWDDLSKV